MCSYLIPVILFLAWKEYSSSTVEKGEQRTLWLLAVSCLLKSNLLHVLDEGEIAPSCKAIVSHLLQH